MSNALRVDLLQVLSVLNVSSQQHPSADAHCTSLDFEVLLVRFHHHNYRVLREENENNDGVESKATSGG